MGIKCLLRMRGCRECLIWGDRFRHANSHVTSGHLFINNNNNLLAHTCSIQLYRVGTYPGLCVQVLQQNNFRPLCEHPPNRAFSKRDGVSNFRYCFR